MNDVAYQKVIDYIFINVKDGKFKVGDSLPPERDLATQLGISRASVREAVSILTGMGMITKKQGSGNYISSGCSNSIKNMIPMMLNLNSTSVKEIQDFRRQMEKAACIQLITTPPDKDWFAEMEEILRSMDASFTPKLDQNFHTHLLQATSNRFWIMIMSPVYEYFNSMIEQHDTVVSDQKRDELIESHKEIFEAIKSGDKEGCSAAIDHHYNLVAE